MASEPQATDYRADTPIAQLAEWLGDLVSPAGFPGHSLRFRNDRWAAATGMAGLSDVEWISHFGRFEPLPRNLPEPLALRYHGHQFRSYNPDLGDGRGFLFAQMRDSQGRLLDLGTKGSGQTPYSRDGDGRLTLKGAVREILATEMLEALGVYTSKTFSVIETGEALSRNDEPSPTRSAVLVRLSHGHIRIGTFQRLATLRQQEQMAQLVDYCLENFPGSQPPEAAPDRDEPAIVLMHQAVGRMADLAASYMAAGFVHGVLNSDNINISGESFDYGPWRWLPKWDPSFTAAYFDRTGLYSFGRQPEAIHWNCAQLAISLRLLADSDALVAALERFGDLYQQAMIRRFIWRLGVCPLGSEDDVALIAAAEIHMREAEIGPDIFFFRHRAGREPPGEEFGELLRGYQPVAGDSDPIWQEDAAPSLLIDEVERIWDAIDQQDDWNPLYRKIDRIRLLGRALGSPPQGFR